MKKIGFIGLGTMGLPMAKHLQDAGYELIVYNRTANKADELAKKGAVIATSPAEVAAQSEVVVTMLTADAAVKEVALGENGIKQGGKSGLIVIDSSTISPDTSITVAKELKEVGISLLDSPVTGSEPQAIQGILTFMVGGEQELFDKCVPLFDVMGQKAYYMGESGSGSYTKLANNTMAAINMVSFAEAITMASKAGIDPEQFMNVVSGGGASSGMLVNKGPKVVDRDFRAHFKAALTLKDLGLATDLAKSLGLPTPALALVKELFQMTNANGFGEEDMCAVVKNYEQWAGIEVKKKEPSLKG